MLIRHENAFFGDITHTTCDGCDFYANFDFQGEHECEKKCDCGCHSSESSDEEMKKNGCDLCYEKSEYYPRHKPKI